jgi:hypothetical protein
MVSCFCRLLAILLSSTIQITRRCNTIYHTLHSHPCEIAGTLTRTLWCLSFELLPSYLRCKVSEHLICNDDSRWRLNGQPHHMLHKWLSLLSPAFLFSLTWCRRIYRSHVKRHAPRTANVKPSPLQTIIKNVVAWVYERTIPTERRSLVGEVS